MGLLLAILFPPLNPGRFTCDQNASLQPIQTSQCFTLSDGNAYFWNVVQG